MSLFPTKTVRTFEIEPDKVTTDNVMAQHLQSIRDEIKQLSKDIASLKDMLKWKSIGTAGEAQGQASAPVEEELEMCNSIDHERFNQLAKENGGTVLATSEIMLRLLTDKGHTITKSTVKNMLRRMRNDPMYDVTHVTHIGKEILYRIKRND